MLHYYMLISLCTFQEHMLLQLSIYELFVLGCPLMVMRLFVFLSLLIHKNHGLCENPLLHHCAAMFVGVIPVNPHETSLVH
jgi:hypothetical protein